MVDFLVLYPSLRVGKENRKKGKKRKLKRLPVVK